MWTYVLYFFFVVNCERIPQPEGFLIARYKCDFDTAYVIKSNCRDDLVHIGDSLILKYLKTSGDLHGYKIDSVKINLIVKR